MSRYGQIVRPWTPEELAILAERRAAGGRICDIARELGRNHSSVFERLRRGKAKNPPTTAGQVKQRVPDHVEADRDRRVNAPDRDLTAAYFGDPKVGYSALERR